MPNIPIYNPTIPEVNVSDRGAQSAAEMARVVGSLGRESAQSTKEGFAHAAANIESFGKALEQHNDYADMQNGAKTYAELSRSHEDAIKRTMADESIPSNQLPLKLAELNEQHKTDIGQWQSQFDHSSPKIKLWATEQGEKYRTHIQQKFEADSGNAAAYAVGQSVHDTVNNATADLGQNPTQIDIDHKLDQLNNQDKANTLSPYMSLKQREEAQKALKTARSEFIVNSVTKMINNDPSQAESLIRKYGPMTSPEHQTSLAEHARTTQRRFDAEQAQKGADAIVQDYLGNKPVPDQGGYLPSPGTTSTNDPRGMVPVIRSLSVKYGHDPDTAVRVSRNEGLTIFNSTYPGEKSYGAFQLNRSPDGTSLGDKFYRETHLDPSDPKNEVAGIDWVLKNLRANGGWQHYHGAARAGIGQWDGVGQQPPTTTNIAALPPRGPSPLSAASASGSLAVGDSIASGLIWHGGVGGRANRGTQQDFSNGATAAVGATPGQILDQINAMPDESLKGRSIVLSGGASNDPASVATVKDQIDALKAKGATNITVLGVGPNGKLAGVNDKLAEIAKDAGATFSGPLKQTGPDQIHPTRWRELSQSLSPAQQQPVTPETSGSSTPPSLQSGGMRPFPSREDMLSRIPPNATTEQRKVYERTIDEARTEILKRTEEDRKSLSLELSGGLEKLQQGESFDFNENTIRHYFEPKTAEKIIGNLADAKQVGAQIGQIRETPIADIFTNINNLKDSLRTTDAADYPEHFKLVQAYHAAAEKHLKALGLWPGQADADKADPVSYLTQIDPGLRNKLATLDFSKPETVQDYTQSMLAWQDHLGIPSDHQHLLSTTNAQQIAHSIIGNPQQAANTITALKQQWGTGYDHVWSDLVTQGKLPAAYQLMGALDNPNDQWTLARGLTEQTTASKKGLESFWTDTIGEKQFHEIRSAIRADSDQVQPFIRSMMNSNASGAQVHALVSAIDTLAFSKMAFSPGMDSATAARQAIDAAVGHYKFLGTARIPSGNYDDVRQQASQLIGNLKLDDIVVPKAFGGVANPDPATYLSVLKANPTWLTTGKEDAIQLMDNGGRVVLDTTGSPLTVKFGTPAAAPPRVTMPAFNGPF